jgi:hypothetical protein
LSNIGNWLLPHRTHRALHVFSAFLIVGAGALDWRIVMLPLTRKTTTGGDLRFGK